MKYTEMSFRDIVGKAVVFPLAGFEKAVEGFPGSQEADCILTFGYIDRDAGISFEVLCCGKKEGEGLRFFEPEDSISAKIRAEVVEEKELISAKVLLDPYREKIEMLKKYLPNEEVLETRKMEFLDPSRDKIFPDDVLVYLCRDGLQPEGCWVRIEGLQNNCIIGSLLNEPHQDFDYHLGERVAFFLQKTTDGRTVCVSNMNPSRVLTEEDLKDGKLLKEAIALFNKDRTEQNFFEVLELLRDSNIWIPCNAVLSEKDQEAWGKTLEQYGDDPEKMKGLELKTVDQVRMIPDILQNGKDFFFPVFSSETEMGEYGDHFSKVEDSFLHAIVLARNNEKKVRGIVVNAFSEPFVLEAEIFDLVEKMKSRIRITEKA